MTSTQSSRDKAARDSAPDLLSAFTALTGIRFAIGAHYQQAQAIELARAGITVRDLELVILYTRRESKRCGYNDASLTWSKLMGKHGEGDEFACFQERLGLAQAAVAKGWRPPFKLSADLDPKPAALRVVERSPDPALFEQGAAAMAAWKAQRKGAA